VRATGIVVELDQASLAASSSLHDSIARDVQDLFKSRGFTLPVNFSAYRVGSAFLHPIELIRS
jgi:hypothetical protein